MKDAKYKWEHDGVSLFQVKELGNNGMWFTRLAFHDVDATSGRKRCETKIERMAAPSKIVSFYYDKEGRQLPGFDIE